MNTELGKDLYIILRMHAAEEMQVSPEHSPLIPWGECDEGKKEVYEKTARSFINRNSKAV